MVNDQRSTAKTESTEHEDSTREEKSNSSERDWRYHALDLLKNFEGYLGVLILFVYGFFIALSILSRVLTSSQPVWTHQAVMGLFIWMSWISVAYSVRLNTHLRFTALADRFSTRAIYIVYWIDWITWLIVGGAIFWFSIPVLEQRIGYGATIIGTEIPIAISYLSIPVGFGLILFRVGQQAIQISRRYFRGEEITFEMDVM